MPARNESYTTNVALTDRNDLSSFKVDPTLAVGDVVVFKDGVSNGNIGTLPTVLAGTPLVTVALTADEMDAVTTTVLFSDQAGDEWSDFLLALPTTDGTRLNSIFASIAATPAQVSQPILTPTNIEIVRGDTYDSRIKNPKLTWTIQSGVDLTLEVPTLTFRNLRTDALLSQINGVITATSPTSYALTFTLTDVNTSALPINRESKFGVRVTEGTSIQTVALGKAFVREEVTVV